MSLIVYPVSVDVICNKCKAAYSIERELRESSTDSQNRVAYLAEQAGWLVSTHGDLCGQCATEQGVTSALQ